MADVGGEAAGGFIAKAGAAGATGALWGIFATALLVIPSIFMGLFAPLVKKSSDMVTEKLNHARTPEKQEPQKSKADREYQRRLAALNAEREEAELAEKLQVLKARRQKASTHQGNGRNVTI